ncbi:hypothetical protein [Microcoleus sp. F4-D5]|uniref:hypothetical protein n=1 Tax=Microcoleus sp. F4-D5 TaxID=2818760 RepID=UPI002FD1DDF1
MEEITASGSIKYGNGNIKTSKFCAELCSDSKGNVILFLWLPLKGLTSKTISRARVWTDWNDKALIDGYVTLGVGRKIASTKKSILYRNQKMLDILNPDLYKWYDQYKRRNIYQKLSESCIHNVWQVYKKTTNSQLVIYEELRYIEEYIAETERK